ncbi:MAG TPA: hypothetical protein VGF48_26865 [Thermoanaerobaculia bacterium]|jgi:hypothetical protein
MESPFLAEELLAQETAEAAQAPSSSTMASPFLHAFEQSEWGTTEADSPGEFAAGIMDVGEWSDDEADEAGEEALTVDRHEQVFESLEENLEDETPYDASREFVESLDENDSDREWETFHSADHFEAHSFAEPRKEETEWVTIESEPPPAAPSTVDQFVIELGSEWSRRRNGSPSAEKITAWLRRDHQETLAGAVARYGSKHTTDSIDRAWMISRREQLHFKTSQAAIPMLSGFAPPADPVKLVSSALIGKSSEAPVAPIVVQFVEALRGRYSAFDAYNYAGHGLGKFHGRGHSIDFELEVKQRDVRGFYPAGEALQFLRAVNDTAETVHCDWRVIYNDFSVANVINKELGRQRVIFVGTVRRKGKRIAGLNWHGPKPLVLHFHLDLAPRANPSGGGTSAPSAPTASPSDQSQKATKPASALVRFAQRVLNATEGESLREDGDPGSLTRGALERFRRKYALGAGGLLDDQTEIALAQRAIEELARASIFRKIGTRDSQAIQEIRQFQLARGLAATGALDSATHAAFVAALTPAATLPVSQGPVSPLASLPALGGPRVPGKDYRLAPRDNPKGLARYSERRVDAVLFDMRKRGLLTVTNEDIDTFQRIANVETSGCIQGLNTWDSAVVSVGFMQWTLKYKELHGWISRAPGAFQRFGIEIDPSRFYELGKDLVKVPAIRGAATANDLRWNGWAQRFYLAGLDPEIIAAEVEYARTVVIPEKLEAAKRSLKAVAGGFALFQQSYRRSLPLRGLFIEAHNNRPVAARQGVEKAIARAIRTGVSDPAAIYQIMKEEILAAFATRDEGAKGKNVIEKTSNGARIDSL